MKIYRYISLIGQFFKYTFHALLAYRFNFLVQSLYGPAYVLTLFVTLNIAFDKAGTLAGWSKQEGLLLFSVYQLLYLTGLIFFLKGIREFIWKKIRKGDLDFMLTKPVNPQFLITFSNPEIQQLLNFTLIFILFLRQVFILQLHPYPLQFLGFITMFILGLCIFYFSVSSYAALGFRVTRAEQIIEFYDKIADFSQYPTLIFPPVFQYIAFTLVPIVFFGYIQTLFLLNKGKIEYVLGSLVLLSILYSINQALWKNGLKHYSSASS